MIDFRETEIFIVEGLRSVVSTATKPCEIVRMNQTGPVPPYPYIAYNVDSTSSDGGTYSKADDGSWYHTISHLWSFTVQSDDPNEAMTIALKAWDWFTWASYVYFADRGIVIESVGDINNRDNLITIEYEHRRGFDVTVNVINKIVIDDAEHIATATFVRE